MRYRVPTADSDTAQALGSTRTHAERALTRAQDPFTRHTNATCKQNRPDRQLEDRCPFGLDAAGGSYRSTDARRHRSSAPTESRHAPPRKVREG
jgi:hypothetical protein